MSIAINQFEVIPEQPAQPSNDASKEEDTTGATATGPAAVEEQMHLINAALTRIGIRCVRVRAH